MGRNRFGTVRYRQDRDAWFVQFTWDGRQYQRRAGTTEAQATRKLDAVREARDAGRRLSTVLHDVFGDVTGHKLTFRDAAPMYLQYAEAHKKPSTFRGDVHRLRILCRAPWAGKYLGQVDAHDLMRWQSHRMSGQNGVSGATVNRDLNLTSALFRWALKMGYVESNPVRSIVRTSERGRGRTLWLTVEECQTLLETAAPVLRPLFLCLLHTGLRRGEVLALEWRSVDLDRRVLVVEPEVAKSGKMRQVPLTRRLAEELLRLRGPSPRSGRVFLRPDGGGWSPHTLADWVKKTRAACTGISEDRRRKVTLHVLRHTFASHLSQQGVPLQEIAKLLGHSSTYVTERYAHLAPDAGKKAIGALERRLDGDGAGAVGELFAHYDAVSSSGIVPGSCPAGGLPLAS